MLDLKLDRPLACLDIESTGANPRTDRRIDLAIVKCMPDNTREEHSFRVNPGIPIPPEVTSIHGISDADVEGAPLFIKVAPQIHSILLGCDLAGYNVLRFDAVLLAEEFARAGLPFDETALRIVDVQRIFHKKEPRDLSAAVAYFCGESHAGAHSAMADTLATLKVFEAQLQRYSDIPRDLESLDLYCRPPRDPKWADKTGRLIWDNGELLINFGTQHKGRNVKALAQTNRQFLKWILTSDFPSDTKRIISLVLEGKFPAINIAPAKPGP